MAWYNIIDNTADAHAARKECKKLEEETEKLKAKIESTTLSTQKLIYDSESLFNQSYKKFESAATDALNALSKVKAAVKGIESNKVDHSLKLDTNSVEKGTSDKRITSAVVAGSSGGIAALGAYTAVGILGTASTGTAIGTLGGVAATNATLAWFGGGAIAAGGGGVAAGAAVLSGIVAAPVFFVAASQAKKHFEKNKEIATKYYNDLAAEFQSLSTQKQHIETVSERINSKIDFLGYVSESLAKQKALLDDLNIYERRSYLSKYEENYCECCIENITQFYNEAVKILSTPIVVEGEVAITNTIDVELIEVSPEIIRKKWRI